MGTDVALISEDRDTALAEALCLKWRTRRVRCLAEYSPHVLLRADHSEAAGQDHLLSEPPISELSNASRH